MNKNIVIQHIKREQSKNRWKYAVGLYALDFIEDFKIDFKQIKNKNDLKNIFLTKLPIEKKYLQENNFNIAIFNGVNRLNNNYGSLVFINSIKKRILSKRNQQAFNHINWMHIQRRALYQSIMLLLNAIPE